MVEEHETFSLEIKKVSEHDKHKFKFLKVIYY
jgi:hypothetical protein